MKKYFAFFLLAAILLMMASCTKKCRCYRYDGNVDEFTQEELNERDKSCTDMEEIDFGLVYSLCEKTVL